MTCFGRVVTPSDDQMYKANFGVETVPVFNQTHVGCRVIDQVKKYELCFVVDWEGQMIQVLTPGGVLGWVNGSGMEDVT